MSDLVTSCIFIGAILAFIGICLLLFNKNRILFCKYVNKYSGIIQCFSWLLIIVGVLVLVLGIVDKKIPLNSITNLDYSSGSAENKIMVNTVTSTLFTTFNTINLSLLAVIVTTYVFLIGVLNEREAYEKKVIDAMIKKYTRWLIYLSLSTGAGVCLCLFADNTEIPIFKNYYLRYCVVAASLVVTILMLVFLYSMINHNKKIISSAKKRNKDLCSRMAGRGRKAAAGCEGEQGSIVLLVKKIGDMELLVNQLLNNHEIEFRHAKQGQAMLSSIFKKKEKEGGKYAGKSEALSLQYFDLVEYRDNYLCIKKYSDGTDEAEGGEINALLAYVREIMDYLKTAILKKEYLADLTLSKVDFSSISKSEKSLLEEISFHNCAITDCGFGNTVLTNTDFSDVLFQNVDFSGANCQGAIFGRARFYGVKFSDKTNCAKAVFNEADFNAMEISGRSPDETEGDSEKIHFDLAAFKMANLSVCSLRDIDFRYSVFANATFSNAVIQDCDFESSDLSEAVFASAIAERAVFSKANVERAKGAYSKWEKCYFRCSRMAGTNFSDSVFENCYFEGAYSNDVSFAGTDIRDVHFEGAVLTNSDLTGTIIENSFFNDAVMRDIILGGKRLKGQEGRKPGEPGESGVWETARCTGTDFSGADMSGALIHDIKFCGCHFDYVLFRGARLKNVIFENCTFQGIEVKGTDLVKVTGFGKCLETGCGSSENKMQCTADIIRKRKSTRCFDPSFEIERGILETMLKSGLQAPSPKNRQPWDYYVINGENKELVASIVEKKLEQLKNKKQEAGEGTGGLVMAEQTVAAMRQASILLLVCYEHDEAAGDGEDMGWCVQAEGFEALDLQSIGASVQNILLHAAEMEIDSLWIGDILFAEKELEEELNLPFPVVAAVALGKGSRKSKPRKSVQEKVNWDFYK